MPNLTKFFSILFLSLVGSLVFSALFYKLVNIYAETCHKNLSFPVSLCLINVSTKYKTMTTTNRSGLIKSFISTPYMVGIIHSLDVLLAIYGEVTLVLIMIYSLG